MSIFRICLTPLSTVSLVYVSIKVKVPVMCHLIANVVERRKSVIHLINEVGTLH